MGKKCDHVSGRAGEKNTEGLRGEANKTQRLFASSAKNWVLVAVGCGGFMATQTYAKLYSSSLPKLSAISFDVGNNSFMSSGNLSLMV